MQDRPIDKVLEQLEDYTERGDEIRARCPAHNGTSEDSLSIREAENGDVLLHCHAECENEDIVEALDLDLADLFSKNGKASKPLTKEARPAEVRTVDELPGVIEDYFTFEDEEGEFLYIQQHKGAYYRVVGEDEDGDPLLIKGLGDVEPVLFELSSLIRGVNAGETIYHLEGCKDVVNAKERLSITATTSGGAKTWKGEFAEHYRGAKEVVILPDNDEEGAAYAQKVAQDLLGVAQTVKIVDLPGLPEKGDVSDWLEAGHTAEEFFEVIGETEAMDTGQAWPEKPAPLDIRLPDVEDFDEELLPEPLREWVFDVAKRMDNAAPDFTAAAAVVQAAALIGRKVGIYPKRHDDWMVIPNLWGSLVGPPASMKTPALEQTIKPTKRLAARAARDHEEALKQHELDKMVAAAEKSALKKQLEDKAKKVAAGDAPRSEMDAIREKIEALKEPEEPTHKRYITNDATIEKLAEILAVNPDGVLYYRDELMGWLRGLDKAGRESDRAFFLEAWNGNGSHDVDRIGRGSVHVPALCVSILGGIQPGPLTKYVSDALEEAEKADGLLQRFQVMVYPDMKGFDPTDIKPNAKARNRAYEVFEKLASLKAEEFGATADHEDEVPCVRFSEDAQKIFDRWRAEVEPRYRSGEYPAAIESHMLKYRSLFASLALLFECVDFVDGVSKSGEVREESALRAAAWCSYLESHVIRIYSPLLDTPERRAHNLLERLKMGDVRHGTKTRDVWRKGWTGLNTAEDLAQALDILEPLGWVRRVMIKSSGAGRPSERLHLHPELRD
jgi:putative DNA primase/helicase